MQTHTTISAFLANPNAYGHDIQKPEYINKINADLQILDSTGNGVGFIFIESLVESDADTVSEIISLPVFKVKGQWIVITDNNICDIARGLINILADGTNSEK
jgi:hypothetical protein